MLRHFVVPAAALALAACAPATLDVLDPAPDRDSDGGVGDATVDADGAPDARGRDAAPPGDGHASADAVEEFPAAPDAACTGLGVDAACTVSSQAKM